MAVQAVIEAFAVEVFPALIFQVFLINKIKPTEIAKTAPLPVDLTHIVVYLAFRWLAQVRSPDYSVFCSPTRVVSPALRSL